MARFTPKKSAFICRRKTTREWVVLGSHVAGGGHPQILGPFSNFVNFWTCSKVWLSSVRWHPTAAFEQKERTSAKYNVYAWAAIIIYTFLFRRKVVTSEVPAAHVRSCHHCLLL